MKRLLFVLVGIIILIWLGVALTPSNQVRTAPTPAPLAQAATTKLVHHAAHAAPRRAPIQSANASGSTNDASDESSDDSSSDQSDESNDDSNSDQSDESSNDSSSDQSDDQSGDVGSRSTGDTSSAATFDNEDDAHAQCPDDVVVWLNLNSGIYHYKGERWYGNTENGAYVCEQEAIADGDRATENGQ